MIDVQEATKLIRDMLPIMDPDEDYMTIVAAEEQISAAEARRKKELEEAHANLKAASKILEAARISSSRPGSVPSEKAHLATLNELDGSKLSLAKAISDTESMLGGKEAELAALKEEARRLETYDPASEHEKELDGSTVRLAIFKGIGFEPILDKHGKVKKMLVRSQSGDIHSVDFTSLESESESAKLLWKLVNS